MLVPDAILDEHWYGRVSVDVTREQGTAIGSFSVPVAIVARNDDEPELELESLRFDAGAGQAAFIWPLTNTGGLHLPLEATLTLTDGLGRIVDLHAGYGRWLLPGERSELRFRTKFPPPPGRYHGKLRINSGRKTEPLELDAVVQVPASAPEATHAVEEGESAP